MERRKPPASSKQSGSSAAHGSHGPARSAHRQPSPSEPASPLSSRPTPRSSTLQLSSGQQAPPTTRCGALCSALHFQVPVRRIALLRARAQLTALRGVKLAAAIGFSSLSLHLGRCPRPRLGRRRPHRAARRARLPERPHGRDARLCLQLQPSLHLRRSLALGSWCSSLSRPSTPPFFPDPSLLIHLCFHPTSSHPSLLFHLFSSLSSKLPLISPHPHSSQAIPIPISASIYLPPSLPPSFSLPRCRGPR